MRRAGRSHATPVVAAPLASSAQCRLDIDIVDEARRVYNRPCSNRPELDAKGFDKTKEAVGEKAADYFACFASRVEVLDVRAADLADATAFRARFQTVFRESRAAGAARPRVRAEEAVGHVMVLDLERHRSLVTPVGPALDGSLGLRSRGSRTCGR